MGKSIIFYFSGTGNSLVVSKSIASKLENCEIISMARSSEYILNEVYDYIGLVYPCYFAGIPNKVRDFVSKLQFNEKTRPYIFAIATNGGFAGNALSDVAHILNNKGVKLDYGQKLKMFSNYVVLYGMSSKVKEKTANAKSALNLVINDIIHKKNKSANKSLSILSWYSNTKAKTTANKDIYFNISDKCTSCGICEKVCPVTNIQLKQGKPTFKHHCEQCMACIQFCPQKAINYKQVTQKRGRYTHPEISMKEFVNYMKVKEVE